MGQAKRYAHNRDRRGVSTIKIIDKRQTSTLNIVSACDPRCDWYIGFGYRSDGETDAELYMRVVVTLHNDNFVSAYGLPEVDYKIIFVQHSEDSTRYAIYARKAAR